MTDIYFYSGAVNKLETTCRLCAKAVNQGNKVLIYSSNSAINKQLDQLLWTYSSTSFVPHCFVNDSVDKISVTPVILGDRIDTTIRYNVLLNMQEEVPPTFNHFERLIEVVSVATEDKQIARNKYRSYQDKGYKIHHFNLD